MSGSCVYLAKGIPRYQITWVYSTIASVSSAARSKKKQLMNVCQRKNNGLETNHGMKSLY